MKKSTGKRISLEELTHLIEDLQGELKDIEIRIPRPVSSATAPARVPFFMTTRGKVATILVGLSAGTGLTWWNIHDQISKGEEPVNLIERLMKGNKSPVDSKLVPKDTEQAVDFYRQAAIMYMRDKIISAKNETLSQIAQDGNIQGLSARLKSNIEKAFSGQPGEVVIKENKGESGCPIFTIMFTQGKNTYIESMGPSEIFNSIDTWITNQLITNHFKGDMATVMLAESYSNQSEGNRQNVIQAIARSSLAVTFDKKMQQNGYELNTIDSGIIWDPATGRPAFKIVYFFGNPAAQQVLIKPFVQLP